MGLREYFSKKKVVEPDIEKKEIKVSGYSNFSIIDGNVFGNRRYDDYHFLTRKAYGGNIYVMRGISYIATFCGGIEWMVYSNKAKDTEIPTHPILSLMNNPNPRNGTRSAFIEEVVSYYKLTGMSYILKYYNNGFFNNKRLPDALFPLRPDRMIINPNPIWIDSFSYSVDGALQTYSPEQVLYIKNFNPFDDYYGLSDISVAGQLIDTMNKGNEYNQSLIKNFGRPAGALIVNGQISPDTMEELKEDLKSSYQGTLNAGKPLILSGGIDWKQFSLSPLDLDWLAGKKQIGTELAMAIGVPPSLLGDNEASTFNNKKEDGIFFIQKTGLPTMDILRDILNNGIARQQGVYLDYLKKDIEELQEDVNATTTRTNSSYDSAVITLNEARKASGYDTIPEGDVFKIATGMTFKPANELIAVLPPVSTPMPSLPNPNDTTIPPIKQEEDASKKKEYDELEYKSDNPYYDAIETKRSPFEDALQKELARHFAEEGLTLYSAMVNAPSMSDVDYMVSDIINQYAASMQKILATNYEKIIASFGEMNYQDIERKFPQKSLSHSHQKGLFDDTSKLIKQWINSVSSLKITQISQTTMEKIRENINLGVDAGESIYKIAGRIKGLYAEWYKNRSVTIARTEVVSSSNAGSFLAARQIQNEGIAGLEKVWLSTPDKRTRFIHKQADGQVADLQGQFTVNGEKLDFPGDTTHGASAKNIINCRCTITYNVPDFENAIVKSEIEELIELAERKLGYVGYS